VDIDLRHPREILALSGHPLLAPGAEGQFDQHGVSLGNLVTFDGQERLYYTGWDTSGPHPWRNGIGLAVRPAGVPDEPFQKISVYPILGFSEIDPYNLSYPFVSHQNGLWRIWYGSHLSWGSGIDDMKHVMKYAESAD